MESTIVVNRSNFLKNFVAPITKFLDKGSFACIKYENEHLVFNKQVSTGSTKFFYSNKCRPTTCSMVDGQDFYLMDLSKLQKILSISKDEEICLTVGASFVDIKSSQSKFRLKLHDAKLARKNNKINSKVAEVLENLSDKIVVDKETTKSIKNSLTLIDEQETVKLVNKSGIIMLVCGNKSDNQFKIKIGESETFEDSEITQGVFRSVGDFDLEIHHNSMENRPVMTFIEKIDGGERIYITSIGKGVK